MISARLGLLMMSMHGGSGQFEKSGAKCQAGHSLLCSLDCYHCSLTPSTRSLVRKRGKLHIQIVPSHSALKLMRKKIVNHARKRNTPRHRRGDRRICLFALKSERDDVARMRQSCARRRHSALRACAKRLSLSVTWSWTKYRQQRSKVKTSDGARRSSFSSSDH